MIGIGKCESTVYTCDRCGDTIVSFDKHNTIGHFKYLHVMKWFIPFPAYEQYKLSYLCDHCWKEFKDWIDVVPKEG